MTFQTYLKINGFALPVQKDDYSIDYSDVVADSGGVTEAGTTIRDVIREGVPSISVSLPVSAAWLKRLRKMKKEPYVNVEWLDPETGELSFGTMYIDGFKVSLEHDTRGLERCMRYHKSIRGPSANRQGNSSGRVRSRPPMERSTISRQRIS